MSNKLIVKVGYSFRDETAPKKKYRRSGHLQDQLLKSSYPDKAIPTLFDSLQAQTQQKIELEGVNTSELIVGIRLSSTESKIVDCLCKLLDENSQTEDASKDSYYSGNNDYEIVDYGGDAETPAPKLCFTIYELTKEYKGGEAPSGKDMENVKQILTGLSERKFLLSYSETTLKKGGGKTVRKIEEFRKLIHTVNISETDYSPEDVELSKREEIVVTLNPIFRRQIDKKYISYPSDITRRTILAYGSHNVSDMAIRLRDYLLREFSAKRYFPEITAKRLYYTIADKWMKEGRRKKVKEYTDKAIETVINLGLVTSYELKNSTKTGDSKYVFTLNKDWE